LDRNVDPVEHAKQEAVKRRVNQTEQQKKYYENDKKCCDRLHSELDMINPLEKSVVLWLTFSFGHSYIKDTSSDPNQSSL